MNRREPAHRPFLALDVDGPIVLLGDLDHRLEDLCETWAGDIPVTVSAKISTRLRMLQRHFDIVWASSWERSASERIAPLVGLPEQLPYLLFDSYPQAAIGESRKLPALRAWSRKRPLAVVDDEIGLDMREWAATRHAPTLLIEVDPRFGILDKHVVQLIAFAMRVSAGEVGG